MLRFNTKHHALSKPGPMAIGFALAFVALAAVAAFSPFAKERTTRSSDNRVIDIHLPTWGLNYRDRVPPEILRGSPFPAYVPTPAGSPSADPNALDRPLGRTHHHGHR